MSLSAALNLAQWNVPGTGAERFRLEDIFLRKYPPPCCIHVRDGCQYPLQHLDDSKSRGSRNIEAWNCTSTRKKHHRNGCIRISSLHPKWNSLSGSFGKGPKPSPKTTSLLLCTGLPTYEIKAKRSHPPWKFLRVSSILSFWWNLLSWQQRRSFQMPQEPCWQCRNGRGKERHRRVGALFVSRFNTLLEPRKQHKASFCPHNGVVEASNMFPQLIAYRAFSLP